MNHKVTKPISLGVFDIECNEYMKYQYLRINDGTIIYLEDRLQKFKPLIIACINDYGSTDLESLLRSYIYLTVKSEYQRDGCGFNRPGWHIDDFGTDGQSYVWSNCQPTIFNDGPFDLSDDEYKSMAEMEEQAKPENNYCFPDKTLIRMGRSVHKVGPYIEGHRVFVKVTFSKEKFNLLGNSKNYLINYDWPMKPRNKERNVPCS